MSSTTINFSIVDERGNINTSLLEKELVTSLAFDIKYKQTDNMKKRACKVATDYNEFKNMVACAHLKKLTRKEVESLSVAKKGWKKTPTTSENVSQSVNTAKILKQERDKKELVAINDDAAKGLSTTVFKAINKLTSRDGTQSLKPKSFLQVEKSLSSYSTPGEKLLYLMKVGIDRMIMLYKAGSVPDIECLEQVLQVVVEEQDQFFVRSDSTPQPEDISSPISSHTLILWLRFIFDSKHFELMIRFTSEDLRNAISSLLCRLQNEHALESEEDEELVRRFAILFSI